MIDKISRTKATNNILRVYKECKKNPKLYDEGMRWYSNARLEAMNISEMFGISLLQSCGILSAFSPQKDWAENKQLAYHNLKNWFLNDPISGHYEAMLNKVRRIMLVDSAEEILEILNGPKVKNFFLNIYGDHNVVTVDRHALDIALGGEEFRSLTLNRYRFIEECYKRAAKKEGIAPAEMQATTWVQKRGKSE